MSLKKKRPEPHPRTSPLRHPMQKSNTQPPTRPHLVRPQNILRLRARRSSAMVPNKIVNLSKSPNANARSNVRITSAVAMNAGARNVAMRTAPPPRSSSALGSTATRNSVKSFALETTSASTIATATNMPVTATVTTATTATAAATVTAVTTTASAIAKVRDLVGPPVHRA